MGEFQTPSPAMSMDASLERIEIPPVQDDITMKRSKLVVDFRRSVARDRAIPIASSRSRFATLTSQLDFNGVSPQTSRRQVQPGSEGAGRHPHIGASHSSLLLQWIVP